MKKSILFGLSILSLDTMASKAGDFLATVESSGTSATARRYNLTTYLSTMDDVLAELSTRSANDQNAFMAELAKLIPADDSSQILLGSITSRLSGAPSTSGSEGTDVSTESGDRAPSESTSSLAGDDSVDRPILGADPATYGPPLKEGDNLSQDDQGQSGDTRKEDREFGDFLQKEFPDLKDEQRKDMLDPTSKDGDNATTDVEAEANSQDV